MPWVDALLPKIENGQKIASILVICLFLFITSSFNRLLNVALMPLSLFAKHKKIPIPGKKEVKLYAQQIGIPSVSHNRVLDMLSQKHCHSGSA